MNREKTNKKKHRLPLKPNIKVVSYEMDTKIASLCGIRTKQDLLSLLLETVTQLNNVADLKKDSHCENSFSITFGDMKRLFYKIGETKIVSFVFPFSIEKVGNGYHIYDLKTGVDINSMVTSVLKNVINNDDFKANNYSIIATEEVFHEAVSVLDWLSESEKLDIWSILQDLFLFEPGYIRYDYDKSHENGKLHPLQHFDVNYTNDASFKLGLSKENGIEQMIKFINKKSETLYLR